MFNTKLHIKNRKNSYETHLFHNYQLFYLLNNLSYFLANSNALSSVMESPVPAAPNTAILGPSSSSASAFL